jgi:hypothetical protein
MHKRIMILFDILVLSGFGAYMAMTVWRLPDELRHRLLSVSMGMLARITGMIG